jgi:hypothetical protein
MDVLLISEATTRLQKGMFAQKFKPLLVAEAKMWFEKANQLSLAAPLVDKLNVNLPQRTERRQKLSLGCGPWREKAAKLIRTAALTGKLKVYDKTFKLVPPEILALIVPIRSALPDHPTLIYSPPHGSLIDRAHLMSLRRRAILLSKSEFDVWYRAEKAKQKWPSQQKARKRRAEVGRPRTAPIWRERIIECVEAGRWNAQESIVALRRLLQKCPTDEKLPSDDTLARIVDALFEELSDDHYRHNKRRPSRKIPNSRNNF